MSGSPVEDNAHSSLSLLVACHPLPLIGAHGLGETKRPYGVALWPEFYCCIPHAFEGQGNRPPGGMLYYQRGLLWGQLVKSFQLLLILRAVSQRTS